MYLDLKMNFAGQKKKQKPLNMLFAINPQGEATSFGFKVIYFVHDYKLSLISLIILFH